MSGKIGIAGVLVALIAIAVAIFQDEIRANTQPEPTGTVEKLVVKGKTLLGVNSKAEKRDVVDYTYMGMGLLALVLGVVSFLAKEGHRVSAASAALGIVAIGWQYVLIGVAVAVVILLIGNLA